MTADAAAPATKAPAAAPASQPERQKGRALQPPRWPRASGLRANLRRAARVERRVQRERKVACGLKAFFGTFLEASLQDALPGRSGQHTRRRDVGRILLEDGRHRFGCGVAMERAASREHLVEDAAEREDVGAMIAALPANLFGRHVADRAEHDAWFGRGRHGGRVGRRERVRGLPRQTEIEDLDRAVAADEHVVRLQIAMRDVLVMRGREAAGNLSGDRDRLPRRQCARRRAGHGASRPRAAPLPHS